MNAHVTTDRRRQLHVSDGRRHSTLMIAGCIPMVVVVGALVGAGLLGLGYVPIALTCLAAMTVMAYAMPRGHR